MVDVGTAIFQLITSGMHDDPLAIYREYIQNAADAFDSSNCSSGSVRISIDRLKSSVTIVDDGPGLSPELAVRALLPIARSEKRPECSRGFRGIGRLSGLAFADSVTFLTRSHSDEPITRVVWDGAKINQAMRGSSLSWDEIRECVTVDTVTDAGHPEHFFEVQIGGVRRHAVGSILNNRLVRSYIGEVCPVPMSGDFSFAADVDRVFETHSRPLILQISIEGAAAPITRPHRDTIRFSNERLDSPKELERVFVPSLSGGKAVAEGWVLHSSYLGAIPKGLGIRGIRARAGNIQIGNEKVFDHLFPEARFNRWCIGEIHVSSREIIPDGKRDYFEPGPHLRNLENHLSIVCRKITDRCRKESRTRNRQRRIQALLTDVDDIFDLVESGFLSPRGTQRLIHKGILRVQQARNGMVNGDSASALDQGMLDAAEARLKDFRVQEENAVGAAPEVTAQQKIFGALVAVSPSAGAAKETIEAVMKEVRNDAR